jgi:hypothetical protein
MANGRPNTNNVLINDLDVGYENQLRKVHCYVPVGGYIDIPGSSRSLLSFDQGTIRKFHDAGVIVAQMFFTPEQFTTLVRPSAAQYPSGGMIWNETEHAPNWADGVTWISFASGGPPAPHATSHQTGGIDPLTVVGTTATNNSATTGLTVNLGNAVPSVTDPGHIHALTDPGHTHTAVATTATNNALTLTGWYSLNTIEADGTSQGTLAQNAASAAPTAQPGVPRCMDVSFPAGWTGGTVTVNGTGRGGAVISETFTKPGGGGTAVGVKPFFSLTNFVNSLVVGAGFSATIGLGNGFGIPVEGVTAFLKVSVDGVNDSFALADTVNGTFDAVSPHHGNHGVDVWYTYSLTVGQASHTHTINSATTGASATSHTTGISVSDTGHTHVVTDPAHSHSQNNHAHNLSG